MIIGDENQTFDDLKTQIQNPQSKEDKISQINNQIDLVNERRKHITESYYEQLKLLDAEEEDLFAQRRNEMNEHA